MELSDYTISECIDETWHSAVYRARSRESGRAVIIKAINTESPAASEIARIRHEYDMIRMLDIEGVVRVVEIAENRDGLALVTEDFGGVSLKEFLKAPLQPESFLDMSIRLSEILDSLHNNNISHRDIKPRNILYNSRTDTLKLTDFGIAAEVARSGEEIYNPQVIEATLAYMSPEQTGRMNCTVDYRTDFYSLGATFYEMLTGRPPFNYPEPMEIIHAHIAKQPVPPCSLNHEIPEQVSDIVMKLLSKGAEKRYQSGRGLAADLIRCRSQLRGTGRVSSFELGRKDVSLKFTMPNILVGREEELEKLSRAFEHAASGGMEIMLVAGEPGIGKSSLVCEMDKAVTARRGYFLSGKYDRIRRHVPYSGIIQAFKGMVKRLLAESDESIRRWREKIVSSLSPNARIITDLIPEAGLIIGEQPGVPELEPEEARNRLRQVLKNFVSVFADRSHPLLLFLDDLQWADPASIDLFREAALNRDLNFVFFIGAFRDNEVEEHHPLTGVLEEAARAGAGIKTLHLTALDESRVNKLLSGFLRCSPSTSASLAGVVYEKTFGNPFFVNQFLKTLYESGRLNRDPVKGWQWDSSSIREMQITDNVVDFMAGKIRDLPKEALEVIKLCSCVGSRFDAETAAVILEKPMDRILGVMETLAEEGFFARKNSFYAFHHDRVQEAAYSLVPDDERQKCHYRVGSLELARTPEEQLYRKVFYIADQLNKGRRFVRQGGESRRLAELNLMAGVKAKAAAAYDAALKYLHAGRELLLPEVWKTDYRLAYELHMELMECLYLARYFEEAEKLFDLIVSKAASRVDKARAYTAMVTLYTNMRSFSKAIELGIQGLRLFSVRMSPRCGPFRVLSELIGVMARLACTSIESVPDLPLEEDSDRLACQRLMMTLNIPAYYVNTNLFAVITLKCANENLSRGLAPHSAVVFVSLAIILENALGSYKLGYRLGSMALRLNEKLGDPSMAGYVHHIFAFFINHWKKHARQSLDIYRKAYQLNLDHGDFLFAGHGVNASTDWRLIIGDRLDEILEDTEKYAGFMPRVKDPFIEARYRENIQMARCLKGLTENRLSLSGEDFDEAAHLTELQGERNLFGTFYTLLYKQKLFYLHGEFESACRNAEKLEGYIRVPMGSLIVTEHAFYYALSLAALLKSGKAAGRLRPRKILKKYTRRMGRWARLSPENFLHRHKLLLAELKAAKGRFKEALSLYHSAIRGARESGYTNDEALACELTADFYMNHEAEEEALTFFQAAHKCYGIWGAEAKQKDLEERFPRFFARADNRLPSRSSESSTVTENSGSYGLDMTTVIQVSQTISSEIVLDSLLEKIMKISVTNAGAQRGVFLLETGGVITVEASEDAEQGRESIPRGTPIEEYSGVSRQVVNYVRRSHEHVILANASEEGPFTEDPYISGNFCKSVLCMPILNKAELTGILYMENNLASNAFTEDRLEILRIVASQAAISLENARLFEQATTDGLTGLFVQRYFYFLLEKEIARSRRYGRSFSLIIMDIDDFKSFNDTYGHQLGDQVLKKVADTVRTNIRASDIAARYGGEEFVLVLPETGSLEAAIAAEKIRKLVENEAVSYGEKSVRVTVSIGLSAFPEHAEDKEGLIRSADNALYASKRSGKNMVSVSIPGEQEPVPDMVH